MVGMASNSGPTEEFFNIGSTVSCTTRFNEEVVGEVIAFDYKTKTIVLRQPSTCGKPNLYNITLLNISNVSDVKVLNECTDEPPELPPLSHALLKKRLAQEVQAKTIMAQASSKGVSSEGQKIFAYIFKTIQQCEWSNKSIVVMDEVLVNPPYRSQDCVAKDGKEAKALGHVKKIVEKYHKEHDVSRKDLA